MTNQRRVTDFTPVALAGMARLVLARPSSRTGHKRYCPARALACARDCIKTAALTSSAKPEVHNISQRRPKKNRATTTGNMRKKLVKVGRVVLEIYSLNSHHNLLSPTGVRVIPVSPTSGFVDDVIFQ